MFSYVAKSLLSKTLRTFLGKYLENIELESIDYGSTSSSGINSGSSQHASGSGWGVSLSNVKLREGMELMKLPGKRKRVVTRKKKVKRNKSKKVPVSNDSTPVTKNTKRKINLEGGEESFVLPPRVSGGDADVSESMSDTSDINGEKDGILLHPAETLPLHEQILNRDRFMSADSENGYFSSNPPTPTRSSHGIFCVPSTFCLNANSKRAAESQQKTAVSKPFNEDQLSNGQMLVEDGEEKSRTKQTAEDITSFRQKNMTEQVDTPPASTGECDEQQFSIGESHDDADISDDDSFVEVEEEFFVEDDLLLVVGAGGVIGTLNIRMVGKELHITVEDAHLIVEAVPRESISDEKVGKPKNDETTKTPQPKKTNLGRSTSSSSVADLPSLVGEHEGETTIGEKIKKKSMLARYLSMVPHLFLRDCRVSLILPEETGDDESRTNSCDDCTVFELGIDFLSVTSGDDFLDVLRFDTGNQSSEGAPTPKSQPYGFRRSSSAASATPSSGSEGKRVGKLKNQGTQNNTFSRKRMRTGKGPDGGVWLKIYPPHGRITQLHRVRHPNEPKWARQQFLDSSESFFLRCSGIDLHARILTHTHEKNDEVDKIDNLWSSEYEDYTMDSMLFGVDYVDPISLTRHQIKNMRQERNSKPSDELSDVECDTDSNGIQSIPFASNFHWIAQTAHRSDCTNSHLPLNDCFYCWNECVHQKPTSISSMDKLMPLPGFVFCLSITDPLEVNVDRSSLEALGYMKSLFTSKKPPIDEEQENAQHEIDTEIVHEDANTPKIDLGKGDEAPSNVASSLVFDDKSFPPFMQPDAIYLSGLYVSTVIIRVEAMQPRVDSGLKFRFWQFVGQSIHFGVSQVDCDEQFLQDVTFHVGSMECKDFTGVCETNLLVAGIDVDEMPTEHHDSESQVHLPCTASRVLGVPSPIAIDKRLNKSYAVHVRLIRSDVPKEMVQDTKVGYVNLQMGMVDVDIGATLIGDISKASSEARSIFFSGSKKTKKSNAEKSKPKPQDTLKWLFQVSTKGGTLSYQPRIKMKVPESKFRARKGSEGLSFETFLQRMGIKYGSYIFEQPTPPSIIPLCSLPESLRMHILIYLDDLTPLERVFNIKKKKSSPFLRSHALNKKMTYLSKLGASSAKERVHCQSEASRRNNVLSQLQSLDIDSLEALLAMHGRSQKK